MTREERLYAVKRAFTTAMRQLDGDSRFPAFRDQCMRAVIGAAALLDRDPVTLADQLADGRLAEYITAAEGTIPLPLDDPDTVQVPMRELLEEAALWAESERDRLEGRMQRVLRRFDRTATYLRRQAGEAEGWRRSWRNTRSSFWLEDDWRRRRGLSVQGSPVSEEP